MAAEEGAGTVTSGRVTWRAGLAVAASMVAIVADTRRGGPEPRLDNVPPMVAALVADYLAGTPDPGELRPDRGTGKAYAQAFLESFLMPDCTYCGYSPPIPYDQAARGAGRAYRRAHPQALEAILADYGYRRVDVDGEWHSAQEGMSRFTPADRSGQRWGVETALSVLPSGALPAEPPECHAPCRQHVVGYVGPSLGQDPRDGDEFHKLLLISMSAPAR